MILVVGATGLVGSDVCLRLAKRGKKVKALVRVTSDEKKVETLRSAGVELCIGDLKQPESLAAACKDASAIISTASSTLSRAAGDSIESVDDAGQLSLVLAAKSAQVDRFVFVSFRRPAGIFFPVADAKAHVENAIADMNFTTIQASWFMEVWLGPHLGFDYPNASARIYGRRRLYHPRPIQGGNGACKARERNPHLCRHHSAYPALLCDRRAPLRSRIGRVINPSCSRHLG